LGWQAVGNDVGVVLVVAGGGLMPCSYIAASKMIEKGNEGGFLFLFIFLVNEVRVVLDDFCALM